MASETNIQRVPYRGEHWRTLTELGWTTARVEVNAAMSEIAVMIKEGSTPFSKSIGWRSPATVNPPGLHAIDSASKTVRR